MPNRKNFPNNRVMKPYLESLNSLLNNYPNYKLRVLMAGNNNFSPPNNGSNVNARLSRRNGAAELALHRKNNGIYISQGNTLPAFQRKGYGTKIRALAILAALRVRLPVYQWSIGGKNSGSYKIMKTLGGLNNYKNHFKFVPGHHNLNALRRRI
jgi:hypothetical protein